MKKDNYYRPIEIVHDFKFIPCTFNQDQELLSPKQRLKKLKELGYGGVALCPSYNDYLSNESFNQICEVIKYAKELDLLVWIYDEKFYPSGSAGGIVPRQNPWYEAKAIATIKATPDDHGVIYINSPHGYGEVISCFLLNVIDGKIDFDSVKDITKYKTFGGGIVYDCGKDKNVIALAFFPKSAFEFCTTSHNTRGVRRYIDTLNKSAVNAFLDKTYGGYDKLGKIGDYVEAVFTDEPQIPGLCRQNYRDNYLEFVYACQSEVFRVLDIPDEKVAFTPYLPWTENLSQEFLVLNGYDVMPLLPRLFVDESEKGDKVRLDYWKTVSTLFEKNYGQTYANFAIDNGVKYSGHFLYEEDFDKHPYMHGDLLCQLGKMDIPGCDMLNALPENILKNSTAIKFASSATDLYDKKDVMIEASNILKDVFPITLSSYALATAIETVLGATRFLSYYTDFATCEEQTKQRTDFTAKLLSRLDGTTPQRKVLVYVPNYDIYGESYPSYSASNIRPYGERLKKVNSFISKISETLVRKNIDFNFINDERIESLSKQKIDGGVLVVPSGVKEPAGIEKFSKVIVGDDALTVADTLYNLGYFNVKTEKPSNFISLYKKSDREEVFLIVNLGEDYDGEIILNSDSGANQVLIYDPFTDKEEKTSLPLCVKIDAQKCKIITKKI